MIESLSPLDPANAAALNAAEIIIRAEYRRLCNLLQLHEVPLDIYVPVDGHTGVEVTLLGSEFRYPEPGYSGVRRMLTLPILLGDTIPTRLPSFPPTPWRKPNWDAWRIQLWHEVNHQLSNDLLGQWDPQEPGRHRSDGSKSQPGHGAGWWNAITHFANQLGITPHVLDELLDR